MYPNKQNIILASCDNVQYFRCLLCRDQYSNGLVISHTAIQQQLGMMHDVVTRSLMFTMYTEEITDNAQQ